LRTREGDTLYTKHAYKEQEIKKGANALLSIQ